MLVSLDTRRPAAMLQLQQLAERVDVPFMPFTEGQTPTQIAEAALAHARKQLVDVVILDTAGRTRLEAELLDELKAVHASTEPAETLFVVDSMAGQDAVQVAQAFGDALPLSGVILTKTDGDARGGVALSVKEVTGQPIKFLGTGENVEGLEVSPHCRRRSTSPVWRPNRCVCERATQSCHTIVPHVIVPHLPAPRKHPPHAQPAATSARRQRHHLHAPGGRLWGRKQHLTTHRGPRAGCCACCWRQGMSPPPTRVTPLPQPRGAMEPHARRHGVSGSTRDPAQPSPAARRIFVGVVGGDCADDARVAGGAQLRHRSASAR